MIGLTNIMLRILRINWKYLFLMMVVPPGHLFGLRQVQTLIQVMVPEALLLVHLFNQFLLTFLHLPARYWSSFMQPQAMVRICLLTMYMLIIFHNALHHQASMLQMLLLLQLTLDGLKTGLLQHGKLSWVLQVSHLPEQEPQL